MQQPSPPPSGGAAAAAGLTPSAVSRLASLRKTRADLASAREENARLRADLQRHTHRDIFGGTGLDFTGTTGFQSPAASSNITFNRGGQTHPMLERTPSAAERRTATQARGTREMSESVKKAVTKAGIPELETKAEYKQWKAKFQNYARALNTLMYSLIVGLVVYDARNPDHVAANDELHTLLVTATKGTWTEQCIGNITAGNGLAAWRKLEHYRVRAGLAICVRKLQDFIGNTRQGPDQTVEDYAGVVSKKADALIEIGQDIPDAQQMQTFLHGLLPKFSNLQDSVALSPTIPMFAEVLSRALTLEETINAREETYGRASAQAAVALAAKTVDERERALAARERAVVKKEKAQQGGGQGGGRGGKKKRGNGRRERRHCGICDRDGQLHYDNECWANPKNPQNKLGDKDFEAYVQ